MRTLKLSLVVIAAAILALLMAAACGGDGDNGDDSGTAEVELPSPGEYEFAVTGTMEIEIMEDQVSAAPAMAQGEDTQTVDLTGDATINFETGEFNIAQFGISGKITLGGEETDIQVNQNPDTPSTGQTTADETKIDLYLEIELNNAQTIVGRNEDPVRLQADGPWYFAEGTTGQGPPFILETPDGSPTVLFYSTSGDTPIVAERAMSLSFTPAQPGTHPDEVDQDGDGDEEPTPTPTEEPAAQQVQVDVRAGCEHTQPGVQSDLVALVLAHLVGAAPVEGATVEASAQGPGILEGTASGVTDAEGAAQLRFPINQFGPYDIMVDQVTGPDGTPLEIAPGSQTSIMFEVGEVCILP